MLMILSSLGFPIAVAVSIPVNPKSPREKWDWVAFPLSVAISFVQVLAMVPLVS